MQSKWDFVGDFCPSRPHLIVYANYTNPRRSIENFLFLWSTQLHRNANIQKYRESQMLQRCYSESGTSNEDVFPSVNYESRSQLLKPKQSSPSLVLALPFFLVDAFAVFRGSSHWFALGMFSELFRYVTTVTSLAPLKRCYLRVYSFWTAKDRTVPRHRSAFTSTVMRSPLFSVQLLSIQRNTRKSLIRWLSLGVTLPRAGPSRCGAQCKT